MTKQTNLRKIILAAGFLIVLLAVAVLPAMAYTDLKITNSDTLKYLKDQNHWGTYGTSGGYTKYFLYWNNPGLKFAHQQKYSTSAGIAYECGKPEGGSDGLCTSFTQSVTSDPYATKSKYPVSVNGVGKWHKGKNVMNLKNVAVGTVVATFPQNGDVYQTGAKPSYHTVVFAGYEVTSSNYKGFWAWDQNYYSDPIIGKHLIKVGGSSSSTAGNGDANNYYVVQV